MLDLERDEVPNFVEGGAYAHEEMQKWVAGRGLAYLEVDTQHWRGGSAFDVTHGFRWDDMVGMHAITTVPSQRYPDRSHAIVIRWEPGTVEGSVRVVVAHDPNPGNEPYDLGSMVLNSVAFLVPRR